MIFSLIPLHVNETHVFFTRKAAKTSAKSLLEPDKTASANQNQSIASDNSIAKSLSIFDHHLLAPTNTFALNNFVGVHNIRLSDSLAELDLKSNILTSGQITVDEFKSAQELDPKIQELRNSFSAKPFVEHQGILCRKSNDAILPVLPQCLEKFLFNCEHFHILAGHRSAKAIITELQNKFHIFQLKQKVQVFCSQCFLCCIAKTQRMTQTLQGTTTKLEFPKQTISFDIFGGLPPDEEGHRWVYTFIDNFSLFVINIKAKTK